MFAEIEFGDPWFHLTLAWIKLAEEADAGQRPTDSTGLPCTSNDATVNPPTIRMKG